MDSIFGYDQLKKDFKTTMEKTYYIMREFPETTNDDELLFFKYAEVFSDFEIPREIFEKFIMPIIREFNFTTIRRARQKIQERGELPPTDPTVREVRERRAKNFRKMITEV